MSEIYREKAQSSHATGEDKKNIEAFLDQLNLDESISVDTFRAVVRALIGARGLFVYFIWKVLEEKGMDAEALVQEACSRWGRFNGEKMGEINTPADFLKELSSKAGTLAWDQEYTILNDEQASKAFHFCPHVAAFKEAGASKDQIARLCKEMMCYGDYGTAAPHPVKLEWDGRTIGEGGERCVMVLTPIDK